MSSQVFGSGGWVVLAWIPHRRDPYRLGSGIASVRDLPYRDALAVADQWARSLANVPRIVIEVFQVTDSVTLEGR